MVARDCVGLLHHVSVKRPGQAPFHGLTDSLVLTWAAFEPLIFDPALVSRCVCGHQLPSLWQCQDWNQVWQTKKLFDHFSIWFPPLKLAWQTLTSILKMWCEERLLAAAAPFFITQTVPAFWWGLSWHLVELAAAHPRVTDLVFPPLLPAPIIALHLAPHRRSLSRLTTGWCKLPFPPTLSGIVSIQRALLGGLPPGVLPEEGKPVMWLC